MKLLLVEDHLSLQTTLVRTLTRRGHQVSVCADGHAALAQWQSTGPDLVLLDLSLPGRDGLTVLADARQSGLSTPVIILTARGTVGDRILGLNGGADDYLAKPFDLDELEARINALWRRRASAPTPAQALHGFHRDVVDGTEGPRRGGLPLAQSAGEFAVDRESGAVYYRGQPLDLPPRELTLLRALLARPGQAVAKERLFEQVFADEPGVLLEAIEVVAYRLRKRLTGTHAQLITLRGLGYLLKVHTASA